MSYQKKALAKLERLHPDIPAGEREKMVADLTKIAGVKALNSALYVQTTKKRGNVAAAVKELQAIAKRRARYLKPPKEEPHSPYHKLFRMVDGEVRNCIAMHPEYFVPERHKALRLSLAKRIAGQINGRLKGSLEAGTEPG